MTYQEWMELGYNEQESKDLVKMEKEEIQYERYAHMAFYSKHL